MNNKKNNEEYYLGLDIGTDSVGYAVSNTRYNLLKFKGEPMWGSHLFDAANQAAERRSFRTARRRLDRRQQRVHLTDEIFMPEIIKIDPDFYRRKEESALFPEDRTNSDRKYLFFNDEDYMDSDYYKEYPTIHHLIFDLIDNENKKFDLRLINIAVDWLMAHRGHFLNEVNKENVDKVLDFKSIYNAFMECFDDNDESRRAPWDHVDPEKIGEILKKRGVNNKKGLLKEALYDSKIPEDEEYFLDRKELITFLSGGKVQCNKLFRQSIYEDDFKITISDDMELILPQLGDDADIIAHMAAMYDWSILSDILAGEKYISKAKINIYETHKNDLIRLKLFVRKYCPEKYSDIFRKTGKDIKNYPAYVYHVNKKIKTGNIDVIPKGKATKEEFYDFLKKTIKFDSVVCDCEDDERFLEEIKRRTSPEEATFLPKQVNTDNRVIPYQLYYVELKAILDNSVKNHSFLKEKDKDGFSNYDKLMSIFEFRIPYYVGPLRKDNSQFAWIEKKGNGKILPWNFDDIVDKDKSEEAFINRMTNFCSYYPGAKVIPKQSLIYSKFTVLNEINCITVNDKRISVEAKQSIYNELFKRRTKVSVKMIKDHLIVNKFMEKNDFIGGIDDTVKSSLKSYNDFRRLLERGVLSENDVESIISRLTYTEDRNRYKKWLKENYPMLSDDDYKYVSKLNYSEFGRLSKELLFDVEGMCYKTGETGNIMHFLWDENVILMELLSDKYSFSESLEQLRHEYYSEHHLSIVDQMEELGLSNAVKRPVIRTLDVVKDVVSSMGRAPKKIFVEMARGADEKKKRSVTRKNQLLELYKNAAVDTKELEKQLENMGDTANNKLQSEVLFLYYLQLGKCLYSGESIDLAEIKTKRYDVDHIYPQSKVKDDSIINNKVLVLSEYNGLKGDKYPVNAEWQKKMEPYWKMLLDNGLMSKEKFYRLTRKASFTEEELENFINRQIVETRQSMKAVTQLLKNLYPDSEIIYVKAGLVSDFRKHFELTPKSRMINDLHHAKDAYLNIVAGNVYNEKFTKKWFKISEERYNMKPEKIFSSNLIRNNNVIWDSKTDLAVVKRTHSKNNIHLTRYAFCAKGGLFDQMPVKKGLGQMPIKAGMDINKYGGYNKVSASFFTLVRYLKGGKKELTFVPVELAVKDKFLADDEFALDYSISFLKTICNKKIENCEFPLGKRPIKIKSVLSLDGYKVWLNGKNSGGKLVLVSNAESLILSDENARYFKAIESFCEKRKENRNYVHDAVFDGLSEEKNIALFGELANRINSAHLRKIPAWQGEVVDKGRTLFKNLDFDDQIKILVSVVELMKSGRSGGCDLKEIGGSSISGTARINANISSYKYNDVRIIDVSPAGLHEKKSLNLMDLLK